MYLWGWLPVSKSRPSLSSAPTSRCTLGLWILSPPNIPASRPSYTKINLHVSHPLFPRGTGARSEWSQGPSRGRGGGCSGCYPKAAVVTECVLGGSQHSLGAEISHRELPCSLGPLPIAPVPLLPRTRKAKHRHHRSVLLLSCRNCSVSTLSLFRSQRLWQISIPCPTPYMVDQTGFSEMQMCSLT